MAYQAQQFRPIGIDENFGSAFQKGLLSPQALIQALLKTKTDQLNNQILSARAQYANPMALAQLQHEQAQAPYLQAETGLKNQESKWYGPKAQSEIGLQGAQLREALARVPYLNAQTNWQNILNKNPLMGLTGDAQQAGAIAYATQHPDMYGDRQQSNQQNYPDQNIPTLLRNPQSDFSQTQQNQAPSNQNGLASLLQQAFQSTIANRQMGGGRAGVGAREQLIYQSLVAKDNPHLQSEDQIREAANVLEQGGNQLSDGTPLNQLSPDTRGALDRKLKAGTTSALATQQVKARQAEAEISVLDKYAQKGMKPYGTTYLGKSPAQIIDSFKGGKEANKRQGEFIASQALQYEIAQNRTKLANGQPGVHTTEELMKLSGQRIDADYPALRYEARAEASRYLNEALSAALKEREKVGTGLSLPNYAAMSANVTKQPNEPSLEELHIMRGG